MISPGVRVLHVCAVWQDPQGRLEALRVGPGAPASETDAEILARARASCAGILTSAANLRAEAALDHRLSPDWLARWRSGPGGSPGAAGPGSAVLTRRGDVDPAHPVFAGPGPARIVTGPEGARRLADPADQRGIVLDVLPEVDPRRAVTHLVDRVGWRPLAIELGPSTARRLYDPPCLVDALWLSRLDTPELDPSQRTGELLERTRLEALLGAPIAREERREASGTWVFERFEGEDGTRGT